MSETATGRAETTLGDFTATGRMVPVALFAAGIGIVSGFVALALLKLIGFFTNLFFYQRIGTEIVSPANHSLGGWSVLVPVGGALIIGVMARYGSERIRGQAFSRFISCSLLGVGEDAEPPCTGS